MSKLHSLIGKKIVAIDRIDFREKIIIELEDGISLEVEAHPSYGLEVDIYRDGKSVKSETERE